MSKKPKNSKSLRLKPKYISRARPIANKYQMIIRFQDGEYYGRGVEMPFAFGDGKSIKQCAKNTRAAFVAGVASLLQDGDLPPSPIDAGPPDQQINIRLDCVERLVSEAASRSSGAAEITKYIRTLLRS